MDSGKHMVIGALSGFGVYLIYKVIKEESPDLFEAILSLIGGALVGLLPDLLEPATNPNHRSFFHSVAAMLLLIYGISTVWQSDQLDENQKLMISILSTAFGSHLVADSTTTRGLPLLI